MRTKRTAAIPKTAVVRRTGLASLSTTMALMTMSRLDEHTRMKNNIFVTCIKRKLRLKFFEDTSNLTCKCGSTIDAYGDHCLGCRANLKTKTSNGIRDAFADIFKRILPIIHLIDTPSQVETEIHNIVPSLPRLKPFDFSIRLDQSTQINTWRSPYSRIGFDVTLIHSTNPSHSTPQEAATYNEYDLRLRDGEKKKFMRASGGTNHVTNITHSPDEVIGEIINSNNVFIPIAIGPFGELGSLFRRFLHGDTILPLPQFPSHRPNAQRAAQLATHHRTPYNILGTADKIWKLTHDNKLFGSNYLAALPSDWANQRIGFACQVNLANHIFTSLSNVTYGQVHTASDSVLDSTDDDWSFFTYTNENEVWVNNDGLHDTITEVGLNGFSLRSVPRDTV